MKKIAEIIKPYLALVFGALMFLVYFNWLSSEIDGFIALGVISLIFSLCYIAIGVVGIVLGEKMPKILKKIFDIATVVMFVLFMFSYFIVMFVYTYEEMGPAGYTIWVISVVASLALATIFIMSRFLKNKIVTRLAYLFSLVFALVLLVNVLFDALGDPIVLGNVNIAITILYILFSYMLIASIATPAEEDPEKEKVEEKPAEPKE